MQELKEHVVRYKLLYSAIIFLVYIVGKNIPLYSINMDAYRNISFEADELLFQTIGGDFYRSSVFALGIFPSMISGLIVQICMAVRRLFTKEETSPKKTGYITAVMTFGIAAFQAITQVTELRFSAEKEMMPVVWAIAVIEMITGAVFIMWLGSRNAKYGVGGKTVFMIVNVLERISTTLFTHSLSDLKFPLLIAALMMLTMLMMENTEKRIPVQRISIHNIYADKNYMAIKMNPVGIMPIMFTAAVFMLPTLAVSLLLYFFPQHQGILWWRENLSLAKPFGIFIYIVCEFLLTIGLSMLMLGPKDLSEKFLKSGDSIVDLHAGRDTRRYLRGVIGQISFFSAAVMGACVAVPLAMQWKGTTDSALTTLPTSIMMLSGFSCSIYREIESLWAYDSCRPLF